MVEYVEYLLDKAYRSYRVWCKKNRYIYDQPSSDLDSFYRYRGHDYIILQNHNRILRGYRVVEVEHGDDRLKAVSHQFAGVILEHGEEVEI